MLIAVFTFWMVGGLHWMEKAFPPKRPKFMPIGSVWIEGLPLPISWHHGWWFGCDLSSSGLANYCRLVLADGSPVYADEYLPCSSQTPIPEVNIHLVPPVDPAGMWLFRWKNDGVIGFLSDGDLLLPASMRENCGQVKARVAHR